MCNMCLYACSLLNLSVHALSVLCSPFPLLEYTHAHAIVMSAKLQCCLYACLVVFLCLVCLLAVCLFVLSCVTHDCACACIVCLLVFCTSPHAVQNWYVGLCQKHKAKERLPTQLALHSAHHQRLMMSLSALMSSITSPLMSSATVTSVPLLWLACSC